MPTPNLLSTPVRFLKGIGPKRAALLARVGIATTRDLLFHVPRRYLDRSRIVPIGDLAAGDEVTVFGKVIAAGARRALRRQQLTSCAVGDGTGTVEAIWFNRPDLRTRFRAGQIIVLSGKVTAYRRLQLVNPDFQLLDGSTGPIGSQMIIPVYPLTEGLSPWVLRQAIRRALDRVRNDAVETLPASVLKRYRFPGIGEALSDIHSPPSVARAERARSRLAYEELLHLELLLALRRRDVAALTKEKRRAPSGRLTKPFLAGLGFELTEAQKRVVSEIVADMAGETCMNRLLMGDVGSGKTVVAVYAMLVAVESGVQATMMAPTELLATQHYAVWSEPLRRLGVVVRLLTGSTRPAVRHEVTRGLAAGSVQMVFGTHALVQQGIAFNRLGLAIVDEQHRFGVRQRAALIAKAESPDFLVMTATPIPRTLVLTVHGDLDVSLIDRGPPGRRPVVTRVVREGRRQRVYDYVDARIDRGEQAFFVCPVIDEADGGRLKSALATYDRVRTAFSGRRVSLLHGRLPPNERARVMDAFRAGDLDIIVATTIVEVGVDVPGAAVMVIEHPERFGLAQLHQLRGRVGRSGQQAVCVLMIPSGATEESERLQFFAATDDGFSLAERDLEYRGPGEILGTRQHGLPDLRVADLVRDRRLLDDARRDAFALVEVDPTLSAPENALLRIDMANRSAGRDELLRVG